MIDIAISTNVLPHYRYAVHKALCERTDAKVLTYAGRNCLEPLKLSTEAQYSEVGAINCPATIIRFSKNFAFTLQWQALRHIFTSKPDAVVVQGSPYELTSWILLLWGRLTGTPVLPWTIGLQGPESGLKWKIRKFMYLMGRGLLVYGDYSRNLLVENGIDPEHIHVIYNSLDLTVQKQALTNLDLAMVAQRRAELAIGDDEQSFCFIGRIVPRKRLHVVLSAIKKLSDQGMQTHFILIGDGDDVPCLEKIAKQLGIEDLVHFIGSLYEEEQIAEYMSLCIGSIIPEAGLPIIHPMSYALVPIISDDIRRHGTEWEAVKEGETGYFFEDDNSDSLASVIRKCTINCDSIRKVGVAAQKLAWGRYSAEAHADRIIEGVKKFTR